MGRRGASLDDLEALYRSRFDVFARVAAGVTGDSERARDAVQEAFATAVRKRRSFRGDGPLEAWVWRIVFNAARLDLRRDIPAVDYDEPAAANGRPERDVELRRRARAPPGTAADRHLPSLLRGPRLRGDRRGARHRARDGRRNSQCSPRGAPHSIGGGTNMTDLDRASLDRILPSTPGSADWDDVMNRSACRSGPSPPAHRRARRCGLRARGGNRVCIRDRAPSLPPHGLHRPAPIGSTASAPESGELVVHWEGFGTSRALPPQRDARETSSAPGRTRMAESSGPAGPTYPGRKGGFPRVQTSSTPASSSNDSRRRASSSCARPSPDSSSTVALSSRRGRPSTSSSRWRAAWLSSFRKTFPLPGRWKYLTATGSSASTGEATGG